jgi:BNR repeat-like domain
MTATVVMTLVSREMAPVCDAFVGTRVSIERSLICAGAGQFPVLVRDARGLAIALRTGGDHYGLDGTLATACSDDGGATWSAPIDALPRGADVRNPAFGIAGDGHWLLAYWRAGQRCYPGGEWKLPRTERGEPDAFVIASDDRGATWSEPAPIASERLAWASPYGRITRAPDGALMMAAYGPPLGATPGAFDAIVLRSRDGGATWTDEALVLAGANELALCFATPELLVGAVRRATGDVAIVHSRDLGYTWSAPIAATRVDEHPADLCMVGDRLVMTFGRRIRPLGCGAKTSRDFGASWSERELMLAGDGIGNDLGYPSTVQLADGSLATAIYFARGSGVDAWGELSCQLLRYDAGLVAP